MRITVPLLADLVILGMEIIGLSNPIDVQLTEYYHLLHLGSGD